MIKDLRFKNKRFLFAALAVLSFCVPAFGLGSFKIYEKTLAKSQVNPDPLSPLASEQADNIKAGLLPVYSLDYYLSLSQSFLDKATRLANDDDQQTEVEKLKILNTLNEALKAANQAIEYYPDQADGYLSRANLLKRVSHLWPEVSKLAQKDLEMANRLMDSSSTIPDRNPDSDTVSENSENPIEFIPTQKANLAQKIIIAEPTEEKFEIRNSKFEINDNALSGEGVLPAGETETTINNPQLTAKHLIYLKPKDNPDNKVLYVKARKDPLTGSGQEGWFKVAIDSPSNKDIGFKWWVIN